MMSLRRQSLTAYGAPLCETVVEAPAPRGSEVLVRIERCGVCHSDLHIQDGYFTLAGDKRLDVSSGRALPFTLGHEIAGVVERAGPEAADDLVWCERILARGAVRDPVAHHRDVPVGIGAELLHLGEHVGNVGGQPVETHLAESGRHGVTAWERRLRRSHDHPRLVDPDAVGNVYHPEARIDGVGLVEQRGMARRRLVDERTCRLRATGVERDRDDLQTVRVQLLAQRLPPGQVLTASSP